MRVLLNFLHSWFGWLPVVGPIIRTSLIAALITEIIARSRGWQPNPDLRQLRGLELDLALTTEANAFISMICAQLNVGILGTIVQKVAAQKVIELMRPKIRLFRGSGEAVSRGLAAGWGLEPECEESLDAVVAANGIGSHESELE